jgi:hypothetical protein
VSRSHLILLINLNSINRTIGSTARYKIIKTNDAVNILFIRLQDSDKDIYDVSGRLAHQANNHTTPIVDKIAITPLAIRQRIMDTIVRFLYIVISTPNMLLCNILFGNNQTISFYRQKTMFENYP